MEAYDHLKIEKKWQDIWEKKKIYEAKDDTSLPKYYALIEFPYPSGDGLHVGHPRPYIGLDVISRKRRAEGFNVLYPIGWDAFGLPTENYAIKTGIHPKEVTKKNTENFTRQIKMLGISFDWSREINTSDPEYYKWTQWIFLKLFEHGLAYKKKEPINWCPVCKIGLANEEVVGGCCERCGGITEMREKEQWMLAITKYAERLLAGLEELDYLEEIKTQQKNWIGKSEGAYIDFSIKDRDTQVRVFTTRPDTLFGATYLVFSPEHELLTSLKESVSNWSDVEKYIEDSKKKTFIERTNEEKEKTGIQLRGVCAINPGSKKEIPIWISDYVLSGYGTGVIMAVPAHDERDFYFAKKYSLPIVEVVKPEPILSMPRNAEDIAAGGQDTLRVKSKCWTGEGELVNSGEFTGMESSKAKKAIVHFVSGEEVVVYKLRDWVFSRQRYWGEPIPIIFCEKCGTIPVPEADLPVVLPDIRDFLPTESGDSPLAKVEEWVNVSCPKCGGPAQRETDVMPNWAGSSWYFLRYLDPQNDMVLASKDVMKHWMPVDWYNGGMEHTTLHLLYSRFWNIFLNDIDVVPVSEPYKKRTAHGLILAKGGEKMSKSKGNVVNPDDIVTQFGADSLRVYEMFMGPFDQAIAWNPNDIVGSRKFLERVWDYVHLFAQEKSDKKENEQLKRTVHKTIHKVSLDIEKLAFNTAIASLMECLNEAQKVYQEEDRLMAKDDLEAYLMLLAPFAPHITEELWMGVLSKKNSICNASWPKEKEEYLISSEVAIVVQVNGKRRGSVLCTFDANQKDVEKSVYDTDFFKKWVGDEKIKKVVFVPNKLINFVV